MGADKPAHIQAQIQRSFNAASLAFKQGPAGGGGGGGGAAGRNPDEHPFEVGHYLVVAYRDNSPRLAKILAVTGNKTEKNWQYYVHYFDFNRRMDEWVKVERILKLPSEANPLGKERVEAEAALHLLKHPGPASEQPATTASAAAVAPPAAAAAATQEGSESPRSRAESPRAVGGARRKRGRAYKTNNNNDDGDEEDEEEEEEGGGGRRRGARGEDDDEDEEDDDEEEGEEEDDDEEYQESPRGGAGGRGGGGGAYGGLRRQAVPYPASAADSSYSSAILSAFEEQRQKLRAVSGQDLGSGAEGPTTVDQLDHDEHEGLDAVQLLEHEEWTKIKNIGTVLLGRTYMECWYFSPFPKEYHPSGPVDSLYFCEFSLRFFRTKDELVRYQSKPNLPRHPPGNEIYRDSHVSMFELDGAVEKTYCQNLCYFAKLFLDHKTLVYDVDPFLFYVLCTQDERGYHPVGYFSKEKYSDMGYNLACILTFPSSQRQGFGRFLIAFSYELSKKEGKIGSPEKPLSDLGNLSYRSYWAGTLLNILDNYDGDALSINDLARMTSIVQSDILLTLDMLELVVWNDNEPTILADPDVIKDRMNKYPQNGLAVDPERLHWAPLYVTDIKKDRWKIG